MVKNTTDKTWMFKCAKHFVQLSICYFYDVKFFPYLKWSKISPIFTFKYFFESCCKYSIVFFLYIFCSKNKAFSLDVYLDLLAINESFSPSLSKECQTLIKFQNQSLCWFLIRKLHFCWTTEFLSSVFLLVEINKSKKMVFN